MPERADGNLRGPSLRRSRLPSEELSLFHLPAHKACRAFGEHLFCLAHFSGCVFAAEDDGTDHVAFAQDRTDNLRKGFVLILVGDLDMGTRLLV